MLSRLIAVAALALLAALPARAQEPSASHLAAAKELVQIIGVTASTEEIIPALTEDIRRQAVTRPEIVKDLNEVLKNLQPELDLQRQQALNSVTRVYAKWLTEPELKEIIAFYKTPVGAKFNKIQPDIVEDAVKELGAWSQQVAEYIMTRTRVEMAKRGHQLQ